MNLLLDALPETVEVNGREYFFNTDFRACIILEKILLDDTMADAEKVQDILHIFFTDEVPGNTGEAMNRILEFYSCGNGKDKSKGRGVRKNGEVEIKPQRVYDFEIDAPYIYAAFLQVYGIDLNEVDYLHWWKFYALFISLPEDCKICKIIGYRTTDTSKIKDKAEKSRLSKLKHTYALPNKYTNEDKIAMAGMAFGGGLF